jgi:hypothetical protein
MYHEGIGKKGGMNVALLIVKTLQDMNILREDNPGRELNIIFDNCSGQNKNNTVLKLALWLKEMGYFKQVNFIFLIVGHRRNACNHLFNLLKHEYWKKNTFTIDMLIETLSVSRKITVTPNKHGTSSKRLFTMIWKDLWPRITSSPVAMLMMMNYG